MPANVFSVEIEFARLADAQKEFGPIRAMATLGWMSGCWLVSALGADAKARAYGFIKNTFRCLKNDEKKWSEILREDKW